MNVFVVNGKTYTAKEFGFNFLCDLEEMGISIEQAQNKPMSMVRAYFAACANTTKEIAGQEMQAHIIKGGKLDSIMDAMGKAMEESDFFRNQQETSETETGEVQSEKKSTRKNTSH